MPTTYTAGQRWISDAEPDLGLGTVLDVEFRHISVVFLASGATRRYAGETAPLTRVAFAAGDRIKSHEGWHLEVQKVHDNDGLLTYEGRRTDTAEASLLNEASLDNFMQFRTPRDRLFTGLLDGHRWFELRRRVFRQRHALAHSPVRGLLGARIGLLPHQFYIAVELGSRLQQRALLADEVGLGKTIEAGLVLHQQLIRGRVSRVLIVVPAPLLHQWLVEMLRKFNLSVSLMDRDRYDALLESAPDGNPFLAEQLVLCSLDELLDDAEMGDAATLADWDLLIVDEAHHLHWSPDDPSPAYSLVEQLAEDTPSALLLTATPEQLGQASHFARLKLLDPDRFSDLAHHLEQEQGFADVAAIASRLVNDEALEDTDIARLEALLEEPFTSAQKKILKAPSALSLSDFGPQLIDTLVDRHGTGRLLFRNTRDTVPGFPGRSLITHELDAADEPGATETLALWLTGFLADHHPDKILFIAERQSTVIDLAENLRRAGVAHAVFHEGMSIMERDRAAAWFADPEENCRLLLCSEIGSEGRNFQFLHRLVTVELPLIPDVLEQRIGRLDRIGQQHRVEVHVPRAIGSRDDLLLSWYHEGLDAFRSICHSGHSIVEEVGERLQSVIEDAAEPGNSDETTRTLATLIKDTRQLRERLDAQLESGRDRLLEINSNRPERIQEHLDAVLRIDRSFRLQDFMESVLDRFGVTVEEQSTHWILQPGDNMQIGRFPGLPDDGLSVTFSRETALAREDLTFLSWDHPMVTAAMDLILDEGYGQADCQVISLAELPAGLTVVEALFVLECSAEPALEIDHFLPGELQAWYVGLDGRDYTRVLANADLDSCRKRHDRNALKQVVRKNRSAIEPLIDAAEKLSTRRMPEAIDKAREAIDTEYQQARERLLALAKVNPSVQQSEIDALDARHEARLAGLKGTHVRPVGLRVLFNQRSVVPTP